MLGLEHGGNRAYRFVCALFILAVHSDVMEERSVHTTHAPRFSFLPWKLALILLTRSWA